jgi:hypothetical protein
MIATNVAFYIVNTYKIEYFILCLIARVINTRMTIIKKNQVDII